MKTGLSSECNSCDVLRRSIIQLCAEAERRDATIAQLVEACEQAVLMLECAAPGAFNNGNTRDGIDEGEVLTSRLFARVVAALAAAKDA